MSNIKTVNVTYDDFRESPRDWCNIAKLCFVHRRYDFPWELDSSYDSLESEYGNMDYNNGHVEWCEEETHADEHNCNCHKINSLDDYIEAYITLEHGEHVTLQVSMYEHGQIHIYCGDPTCRWDSGVLGFAFISKKDMIDTGLADQSEENMIRLIEQEVSVYSKYANGEVYILSTEDESIGGIYESDNYTLEDAAREYFNISKDIEIELVYD